MTEKAFNNIGRKKCFKVCKPKTQMDLIGDKIGLRFNSSQNYSSSHQLSLINFLSFVHIVRRSYQLNDPVKSRLAKCQSWHANDMPKFRP